MERGMVPPPEKQYRPILASTDGCTQLAGLNHGGARLSRPCSATFTVKLWRNKAQSRREICGDGVRPSRVAKNARLLFSRLEMGGSSGGSDATGRGPFGSSGGSGAAGGCWGLGWSRHLWGRWASRDSDATGRGNLAHRTVPAACEVSSEACEAAGLLDRPPPRGACALCAMGVRARASLRQVLS